MDTINYVFRFEDGEEFRYTVGPNGFDEKTDREKAPPNLWVKLDYHQCANCPLDVTHERYCPVAVDIYDIAEKFKTILSYQKAKVWVITPRRSYYKECDVQTGLRSLFGLIMARSMCPVLKRLRPLAVDHLPFATADETIKRVVGSFLLKQHYLYMDADITPDWRLRKLEQLYEELEKVNHHLMARLQAPSEEDSVLNAISTFFALSSSLVMAMHDLLEEIRPDVIEGF